MVTKSGIQMATHLDENTVTAAAFQLKGGLYTLTTIQLLANDLDGFQTQLEQKIQQAPNFFCKAPVIIDYKLLNTKEENQNIDFLKLKKILQEKELVLVGIKNANEEQQAQAMQAGLAILRDSNNFQQKEKTAEQPKSTATIAIKPQEASTNGNKLITTPVRSGQQIYVPDGDLIITSSVSHGAELLADGNIHVYGVLRGRALAGINGNKEARIFCSSLEAELISIAGNFKISEDIEKQAWKIPAEIYLQEDHLQIRKL